MIIREVAGWDHDAVQRILDWPIREMLLAYVSLLKQAVLEGYRLARLEHAIHSAFGGKAKPPKVPKILGDC